MYTTDELDAVIDAWVHEKGNNAMAAALAAVMHRFKADYSAATQAEDKSRLAELDLFRKGCGRGEA